MHDVNQTHENLPYSSSFNRFTRSIGDVIAYTTGDVVSSGILTLSKGLGKYIPLPTDTRNTSSKTNLVPDIVSVSSFKNLSDHSLVEVLSVADLSPPPLNLSLPESSIPPPKRGIFSRIKSIFRRKPRQETTAIESLQPKRSLLSRLFSWIPSRFKWSSVPSEQKKPSLIRRFRNKLSLILRRRIYNIWERPPPLWSKFKLRNVGIHVSKPKSPLFPKQPERRFWNILSFFGKRNYDAEYMDLESNNGKNENYHIFKDGEVNAKLADNKGLLQSMMNGISTSKDYLNIINGAGSAIMKMNRLEGLFSDGKSLMSVSVQLLSNATEASLSGLNVDYIGGAGSLFIKTLASTPSIIGNIGLLNRGSVEAETAVLDLSPESAVQQMKAQDLVKAEGNSFFPLVRFIRRRMFGTQPTRGLRPNASPDPLPGILNAVPVVRLLPRVSSWVQQATDSIPNSSSTNPVADAEIVAPPALPAPPISMRFSVPALPFAQSESRGNGQLLKGLSLPNYRSPQQTAFPQPSKGDLILIKTTRIVAGVRAALTISNPREFNEFMNAIGLRPVVAAVIRPPTSNKELRLEAVRALRQLIRFDSKIIPSIISKDVIFDVLTEMMQAPFQYNLGVFRSEAEKTARNMEQYEALALILRLVRESDTAVQVVRKRPRLIQIINQIRATGDEIPDELRTINKDDIVSILSKPMTDRKSSNSTIFVDYDDLKPYEMVNVYFAFFSAYMAPGTHRIVGCGRRGVAATTRSERPSHSFV